MRDSGKPANVKVMGVEKGAELDCKRRGTAIMWPMDYDSSTPNYSPTPVEMEFITCERKHSAKFSGGYEPFYAAEWNANSNLRVEGGAV